MIRARTAQVLVALALTVSACESTPILLYHSVGEELPDDRWVTEGQFRAQMERLLDRGYTVLTARELDAIELAGHPRPPHPVVLTFDDGYRNFLQHAAPILRELNIRATLFIPTARIGEEESSRFQLGVDYLVWPEIRRLEAEGIDIESHSQTHPRLRDLDSDAAYAEIAGSKQVLEEKLGHEVSIFAYPGGSLTPALEDLVERAGYASAHSVSSGLNSTFARQRISVHAGVDLEDFERMVQGTWWGESSGTR